MTLLSVFSPTPCSSAAAQVRQTFYETAWDEIKNFASESVFGMLCGAMADFVPEVALPTR